MSDEEEDEDEAAEESGDESGKDEENDDDDAQLEKNGGCLLNILVFLVRFWNLKCSCT